MLKHRLKMTLREAYARLLFHTGLHALVNRMMPRRLTILAGHCVAPGPGDPAWPGGEHLPPDMMIGRERLERIVTWFQGRYRVCSIGEGVDAIAADGEQSLLALSMDDGYRDNHDVMLPLLQRLGVSATVFLESRPLDERRVSWSHKLFWILARTSASDFVERYGAATDRREPFAALQAAAVANGGRDATYLVKRLLKYEVEPADRDPAIDGIFADLGGVDSELCDALYMTWDDARALRDAGVELGGHTVTHPILSSLDGPGALAEIRTGAEALERELGQPPVTFAYPWGRRWDFNAESRKAVEQSGFRTAVTMHGGTNDAHTDPTRLHRLAIDDDARLHLLVAEACGGFDLARKLGVNLSE